MKAFKQIPDYQTLICASNLDQRTKGHQWVTAQQDTWALKTVFDASLVSADSREI